MDNNNRERAGQTCLSRNPRTGAAHSYTIAHRSAGLGRRTCRRANTVVLEANSLQNLLQLYRPLIRGVFASSSYQCVIPAKPTRGAPLGLEAERYTPVLACFNTPLMVSTFS